MGVNVKPTGLYGRKPLPLPRLNEGVRSFCALTPKYPVVQKTYSFSLLYTRLHLSSSTTVDKVEWEGFVVARGMCITRINQSSVELGSAAG